MQLLKKNGRKVHEITSCKTYEQYQEMAESESFISYYPAAIAGGNMLAQRLGRKHIYVPFSFDYAEIEAGFTKLAESLNIPCPNFADKRVQCEAALQETLTMIGNTPIAIDYTFCPRPLGLAKLLLDKGFNVQRVYLDVVTGEEKAAFEKEKLLVQTQKELSAKNVPIEFADMLVKEDAEATKAAIDAFAQLYNQSVEKGVSNKMKGRPPKTKQTPSDGLDRAAFMKLPLSEQQKMAKENPERYKELTKK